MASKVLKNYINTLHSITNKTSNVEYTILSPLGEGAYGVVFKVRSEFGTYAAKFQPLIYAEKTFENEIEVYKRISKFPYCNNYIICLHDHFTLNFPILGEIGILIMELMEGDADENPEPLTLTIDILHALSALHSLNIKHGDLALQNIFYKTTKFGKIYKLGDFGFSKLNAVPKNIKIENQRFGILLAEILYPEDLVDTELRFAEVEEIISKKPPSLLRKIILGLVSGEWDTEKCLDYIIKIQKSNINDMFKSIR